MTTNNKANKPLNFRFSIKSEKHAKKLMLRIFEYNKNVGQIFAFRRIYDCKLFKHIFVHHLLCQRQWETRKYAHCESLCCTLLWIYLFIIILIFFWYGLWMLFAMCHLLTSGLWIQFFCCRIIYSAFHRTVFQCCASHFAFSKWMNPKIESIVCDIFL